jgi:hypothetical protein
MAKGRIQGYCSREIAKSELGSFGWPYNLGVVRSPNLRSGDNFNTKAIFAIF